MSDQKNDNHSDDEGCYEITITETTKDGTGKKNTLRWFYVKNKNGNKLIARIKELVEQVSHQDKMEAQREYKSERDRTLERLLVSNGWKKEKPQSRKHLKLIKGKENE